MRREGRDEAGARARILQKDEERRRYLQTFYQREPSDAHLYDIILNTGVLDLDSVVDLIALALGARLGGWRYLLSNWGR